MSWLCNKALTLGGTAYNPGDTIPDGAVIGTRVRTLKAIGYISDMGDAAVSEETLLSEEGIAAFDGKVVIPIIQEVDEDTAEALAVPLTEGEVQRVFAIMQMTVDAAEKEIAEVEEDNVLIVLHAADSRTGIKKAAKKRSEQLSSTADIPNESVGVNETTEGSTETDTQPEQ